jgi:TRAP-type C4-dicarboxylate transport system substrate-binding protein
MPKTRQAVGGKNQRGCYMRRKYFLWSMIVLGIFFWMGMEVGGTQQVEAQEVIKLKIGTTHPPAATWVSYLQSFFVPEVQKRVNEKTKYKLELAEHYSGSVAKVGEIFEATEIGLLDIAGDLIVFEPSKLYLVNWPFYLPFGVTDPSALARITTKLFKQFPVFNETFKKHNLIMLGAASGGDSYEMSTNFPLRTTADLKGHKIAGAGANLHWLAGSGAVPVQSNLNEAYTSLQTGVYEGWIMTVVGTVSFKLHEISRHFTTVGFGPSSQFVVYMNLKTFNKMPPEVQKILKEVGEEFAVMQPKAMHGEREKGLKVMKDSGVTFYDMPFEERVKWANMIEDIPAKFAREADAKGWPGTAIMRAAIKLSEEEGAKFPRKWMSK